jgi:hypothetical protein
VTLRRWASDSSCFKGARCLHLESVVHQHCLGDAFNYFILHDVAGVWRLFNDAVSNTVSTASINKLKKKCMRPLPNLWYNSDIFLGIWKTTNQEVFHDQHLWAKNANRDSRIRSALVRQLLTWRQNAFIQTFTHTYIHTFHWSNIRPLTDVNGRMLHMSNTIGCSTQLCQRNILNKIMCKIYVGETLKWIQGLTLQIQDEKRFI